MNRENIKLVLEDGQEIDVIEHLIKTWNISVYERDVFLPILELFRNKELSKIDDLSSIYNAVVENDFEDLLEYIPDKEIESYAEDELNMIQGKNKQDLVDALEDLDYKFIGNVDVEDMIDSLEKDGYTVEYKYGSDINIVLTLQLKEMTEKFLKLSIQERDNLIKNM